jgi:hypothetical protein
VKGELRHSLFKRREITIFFPLEEEGKLFSSPPSRGRGCEKIMKKIKKA